MMMPAAPVATAMLIMLREPEIMPVLHSPTPCTKAPRRSPSPRSNALSGCWVRATKDMNIAAQKADNAGDRRSGVGRMHQISTTIGNR